MIDINKAENGEIINIGIWHPFLDGVYHHLVQVYDGKKTKYYVDGKRIDMNVKGKVTNVTSYPYALTEEEIAEEYNKGAG